LLIGHRAVDCKILLDTELPIEHLFGVGHSVFVGRGLSSCRLDVELPTGHGIIDWTWRCRLNMGMSIGHIVGVGHVVRAGRGLVD
jgi:hypothetical protein